MNKSEAVNIDIGSEVFHGMLQDLDKEIKRVLDKVYKQTFSSGEITLKLSIETPERFKEYPKKDDKGEVTKETYWYKSTEFEHKITTNLKQQYKTDGIYSGIDKELIFKDKEFVLVPVEEPQVSFDENEFLK